MSTVDGASQPLIDLVARLRAGWPGGAWEWDGRLGCALSTVSGATEAQSRSALAGVLPQAFAAADVTDAPDAIQQICADTGGLRGTQKIFFATLPDGAIAYCLWWPWGGNDTFSARVGAADASGGDALTPVVRSAFGLR